MTDGDARQPGGRLLYRVTEAATMLGLSRGKVNQLIASGELGSVKIDAARRIPAADLCNLIERHRVRNGLANGGNS